LTTTAVVAVCFTGVLVAPAQGHTATQGGLLVEPPPEAQVVEFDRLSLTAQVAVLEDYCTTLSSGTVVFTCEDEVQWATELAAPMEIVYNLIDLANFVLANNSGPEALADALVDDTLVGAAELYSGPALQNYMASLTQDQTASEDVTLDELAQFGAGPISIAVDGPDGRMFLWFGLPRTFVAKLKCGFFGHDVPKKAAQRIYDGKVPAPENYLSSQGYHKTRQRYFGGGWTKPQTYQPYYCGADTFRDHGHIAECGTTNYGDGTGVHRTCFVVRQEYYNAPYGEPNPEFYRSGPWPYITWPAYVAVWHANH
jgi:hypothetical protein